jgi:hypothetical protein
MGQFRDASFVVADSLEFIDIKTSIILAGEIACVGRIVIDVMKRLEYVDPPDQHESDPRVQTSWYAYNVSVRGVGTVFRYDNQHPSTPYDGHCDPHHKHVFDWPNQQQAVGSPFCTGADGWPTLGEVIEEARSWYRVNYAQLSDPHGSVAQEELRKGFRF